MRTRLFALTLLLAACSAGAAESLTVRTAVQPSFPLSLRGTVHSDGHAIVALTIDEQGRVDDAVALEASHPDFALAAVAAVSQWIFEPVAAKTRPPRDVLQFEFRSAGVVSTLTHVEAAERSLTAPPLQPQLRTVNWSELSTPPQALSAPAPRLRGAALGELASRPVIVSFVIDTDGVVHVPVVDSSAGPEVAQAVLGAVRAWRFSPPRHAGEAVLVQAYRAFGGAEGSR